MHDSSLKCSLNHVEFHPLFLRLQEWFIRHLEFGNHSAVVRFHQREALEFHLRSRLSAPILSATLQVPWANNAGCLVASRRQHRLHRLTL